MSKLTEVTGPGFNIFKTYLIFLVVHVFLVIHVVLVNLGVLMVQLALAHRGKGPIQVHRVVRLFLKSFVEIHGS